MNTTRLAVAASVLALTAVSSASAQGGACQCRATYYHATHHRHVVRHVRYVRRWGYAPRYGYGYGAAYEIPEIYGDRFYDEPIWPSPVVTRVYDDWDSGPAWYGYGGPGYIWRGGWGTGDHRHWRHGDRDEDEHGHWDHGRHRGWR